MSAYQRGNSWERKAKARLEDAGYFVWQSRGSKTVVDILAIKPGQVLFVQVKGGARPLSHDEWNGLLDLAGRAGALPVVATRAGRSSLVWRKITHEHEDRRRTWPSEPFVLDQLTGR